MELVCDATQLLPVFAQVNPDPWLRLVLDAATKMSRLWIEDDDTVTTDEAGDVGEVVDCVEAESEATDLVCLALLRCSTQLANVLEIVVRKDGVVVNLHCKNHIYFCTP